MTPEPENPALLSDIANDTLRDELVEYVEREDERAELIRLYARRKAEYSGITYALELTDNLVSNVWTGSGYAESGSADINDVFEAVTNAVPTSGMTNQFIRLQILRN